MTQDSDDNLKAAPAQAEPDASEPASAEEATTGTDSASALDYAAAARVATPESPIVAKAFWWYMLSRYVLAAILFGYGLMSIRDGFYRYPRENADATAKGLSVLPHPGFDVQFNQAFGVGLPPLSLAFAVWAWWASRGRIRFDGQNLDAPGHPTVNLDTIKSVDASVWDRKGIAYLEYEVAGTTGRIKLDDFIYEREPIDAIYKAITTAFATP